MPMLEDLLEDFENEEEIEKTASNDEVEGLADAVFNRAMEKLAGAIGYPKGELSPEEMQVLSDEGVTPDELEGIRTNLPEMEQSANNAVNQVKEILKQNILQAGKAVVDDATAELNEEQVQKIATIQEFFVSEPKKELFEKLARAVMTPRVIVDENFSVEETLDGHPKVKKQMFDFGGKKINKF